MRRAEVTLVIGAVVIAAACVSLGIWQLRRLGSRRARNALAVARLALPPLEVRDGLNVDSARGRRVTARGAYDFDAERTWPGRSFEGTPGVALITPLRLAGGAAVLVDRGWVYSPDGFQVDHAHYREPDSASVTGIAVIPPRGRGDVSTVGFLPIIIQLAGPDPASGLPRRWPAPAFDDGPHLSYAIQWFSFALIALVGTAALIRNGRTRTAT